MGCALAYMTLTKKAPEKKKRAIKQSKEQTGVMTAPPMYTQPLQPVVVTAAPTPVAAPPPVMYQQARAMEVVPTVAAAVPSYAPVQTVPASYVTAAQPQMMDR